MELSKGQRLPFFRLSTLGGTSKSRDDFLGRPALYVGWASWDVSREGLPELQKFVEANGDRLEVVAIAFDVHGPDLPMRYLRAARYTFTALIDATCELSRLWGAKTLPFGVLVDENAVVRLVGDAVDEAFLAHALAALKKANGKAPLERKREHTFVKFEYLLQSCTNLLGRGRREEALVALQEAMQLDPANFLVRRQMWAIAHPERFYQGPIDLAWQKVQEEATRSIKPIKKR